MYNDLQEEKRALKDMDDEEMQRVQAEKSQLKQMFRADDDDADNFFPLFIKASQQGALETLMTETDKIIQKHYQIQILDTGVGHISEADVTQAATANSTILGFDVACSQ